MKALTLVAPSTFEFGEAPAPQPQHGEVLVDIKACGICGSDLHGMDGRSGRRIPPIIMGHEAAGEISAVGDGVSDWSVGDRVTFDSTEYCGTCPDCEAGNVNLCKNRKVLGVSCGDYRRHGCFAEQVVLPQHILYRLPKDLAYEKAAFAEPVSIALHAVNLAPAPKESSPALTTRQEMAVVVGAGLIGLLVLQALKARGWKRVFAVDLDDSRLALAKELGAEAVFNAKEEGVAAKLKELGGGDGIDASFEVVGAAAPVDLAIKSVRKGGTVVLVGNLQATVPFPLQEVVTRQITLKGSCSSAGEYAEALERIEDGSIRVEPLLSVVAPLSEGGEWFHKAVQPGNGLLKVVLKPE
ncbi:MAG: zinc-binding dehydrogenase [Verrucomicrobium sp.]